VDDIPLPFVFRRNEIVNDRYPDHSPDSAISTNQPAGGIHNNNNDLPPPEAPPLHYHHH
jgi:hypothetical protein